jgi:hypothetical protein
MRAAALLSATLLGCLAPACDKPLTDAEIRTEIEKARNCAHDTDCINLGARCPFGCAITVARSEAERIRQILDEHEESCTATCATYTQVLCEKGLCTPR